MDVGIGEGGHGTCHALDHVVGWVRENRSTLHVVEVAVGHHQAFGVSSGLGEFLGGGGSGGGGDKSAAEAEKEDKLRVGALGMVFEEFRKWWREKVCEAVEDAEFGLFAMYDLNDVDKRIQQIKEEEKEGGQQCA